MHIPKNLIINADSLTQWFGYWPDFHDFEIVRVEMDRSEPSITIQVYAFQTVKESDEKGYFKRAKECLVTLKFNAISEVALEGFNQQNVLSSLAFEEKDGYLKTKLSTVYGLSGFIISKNLQILGIESRK
jgi:hypothetical protein